MMANVFYAQNSDPLKGQLYVLDEVDEYKLIVKFRPKLEPVVEKGKIQFLNHSFSSKSSNSLTDLVFTPVVKFTEEEKQQAKISSKRKEVNENGFNILDFAGLCEVTATKKDKHYLLALGKQLEKLAEVEYCSLEPVKSPPPPGFFDYYATPNLVNRQGYRKANPGIDVDYAWSQGAMGQGVKISDIEYSWGKLDHEEFINQDIAYGSSHDAGQHADHGIAVMGILVGDEDNNVGIKGTAPKAVGRVFSEVQGRAAAIINATKNSKAGDVIVLEMQTGGPDGNLAPADVTQSVWDAVRAATNAGIIVVAAAGNGNANLDSSSYRAYRNRGDNGSIIVGAGSSNTSHSKLSFSTYGQRVDVQGWGQNVFTTGYGHLTYDNDYRKEYTPSFSGTSSATPVVTSAVACIQSYALSKLGKRLKPREMRDLLKSTGVAQGGGGHIGPLPNIKAAIQKLGGSGGCSAGDPVTVTFKNTTDCTLEYYQNNVLKGSANAGGNFTANTTVGSNWVVKKPSGDTIDNFSIVCNQTTYSSSGSCTVTGNPCDGVSPWSSSVTYSPGDRVTYQGNLYEKTATGWKNLGPCGTPTDPCQGVSPWSSGTTYSPGDKVTYQGRLYEKTETGWKDLGACGTSRSAKIAPPIEPTDNKLDFAVYPNPAKEILNIDVNLLDISLISIELNDINGKRLKTETIKAPPGRMLKGRLDVSDLPKGIYFLRLTSAKSTMTKKVFIK